MMKRVRGYLLAAAVPLMLGGCSSSNFRLPRNLSGTLQVTPSVDIAWEKLLFWGAYAGAAYLVLDPWAPNWEIAEAKFPGDHYKMSLHMKRYYAGGAGEARQVFHRRARDLAREGGFDGYQVIEYSESLDSSVLGSQRRAEGVILLTRADQAT